MSAAPAVDTVDLTTTPDVIIEHVAAAVRAAGAPRRGDRVTVLQRTGSTQRDLRALATALAVSSA